LPDRQRASLDATLQSGAKGTLGSRRAPVKDGPVLGATMKEDPELNLAILALEQDLARAGEWSDQSQLHA